MKKGLIFLYILALCLSPMVISASSATKTIHLSIGESIEADSGTSYPYLLTFSGFYDKSIALEWRNEWCESYGKSFSNESVNNLYYYPIRTGFSFTLPENPRLKATITSIDEKAGKITLELKNSTKKEKH